MWERVGNDRRFARIIYGAVRIYCTTEMERAALHDKDTSIACERLGQAEGKWAERLVCNKFARVRPHLPEDTTLIVASTSEVVEFSDLSSLVS